ncbi:MAG: UvrD-helicase domain-containing protein, partial [Chloroflexi bacterium]|nr:UvrD-helicase domain-containing protein [Chloroflexota bacterium]
LKDLNLDDKKFSPNRMLNGISNAKNELITAEMYTASNYIAEVTKRVYGRYQQVLIANNGMDFDDLLMNTVLLFDQRPDVLQKYQERYRHILVDEFQDTNTAQYGLLQRLASGHGNIFAVGDSDQSIYKWRGADYRNINKFRETYANAKLVLLEQNYRSTQIILDVAKAIIKQNKNRVHKELFTTRQGGEKIVVREVYDEREEADVILGQIQNMMLDGYSPGDMALMYRTNAQSRVLEEAFVRAQMPYKLIGATQFYKRREVKDVISYLRLVHNPLDSVSFARAVNTPTRGIGKKTQQNLQEWAFYNGISPSEAVIRLATDPEVQHTFNGRSFNALSNFGNMLNAWLTVRDSATVGDLLDLILEQIEYRDYIERGAKEVDEARDRWANVMELRGVALMASELTLGEFLEQIALVAETDNLEEDPQATTLLTLHAAKGLEFPVVFLTGLEDGVLPHSRSMEDSESLAEERRLFYVGITRAKDKVFITHAFRRTFYGETEVAIPSRFLQEIPEDLTEGGNAQQRREATTRKASSWNWSSQQSNSRPATKAKTNSYSRRSSRKPSVKKRPSDQPPVTNHHKNLPKPHYEEDDFEPSGPQVAKYKSGQKVRHSKFGEGTVIESKLTGNDEEVSVAFADVGVKRLAASFAKLEIL